MAGYAIDVRGDPPVLPVELTAPAPRGAAPEWWIVQLSGPVHEAEKQALRDLGVRIGDYVPDFAFLVSMDPAARARVLRLGFVRGVVRHHPAFRIAPSLKDPSGNVRAREEAALALHVRLDGAAAQPAALSEVYRRHGRVLDVAGDVVRIALAPGQIAALAQREDVLWIEEALQPEIVNETTRWVIQSDVAGSTPIWDAGLHGEGQIVGIGDTGLDYDMPWFYDPSGVPPGPNHRKVIGYDTTYGDDYDANEPGHGTHVAGTVGGDRTPVDGGTAASGMAPKTRFFISDLTAGASNSVNAPSDLGLLLARAYDAGARLHTNSWGANDNSYSTYSMTTDRYLWSHKDLLVMFANGNAGPAEHTVGSPATAKDVVSVGASLNGSGAENVTWFSSKGPTSDGRLKPTVCAPGDGATDGAGIVSADSDGVKNSFNSGTRTMRGTSMATPAVTGAAALVRQYFTDGRYPSGAPTAGDAFAPSAALMKAVLVNGARSMSGANVVGPFPATGQGWGRVTLSDTLAFLGDGRGLVVVDDAAGLATDGTFTRTVFPVGDRPLKVTVVWTDYPGAAGATKALVNDLDLSVTAPDGTVYAGNVFQSGASVAGGAPDR
ncbi:MAG TPA: S8 family serine peptidase, partial [Frankiaceae bacterium]|nr:S8 family serine peptidase [Frankiaceae bacterium]